MAFPPCVLKCVVSTSVCVVEWIVMNIIIFVANICFSLAFRSRLISVSIVPGYGLDDRAIQVRSRHRQRICPLSFVSDRLWGPPSLLYNRYCDILGFLGGVAYVRFP
jgi:hypothetical protein